MKPKVIIENEVYRKIMHWVNKSSFEVSGLGTVLIEPDGVLRVVSAMLLPQKNGATHTDIEADVVGKAMFDLRNEAGELRFWWHSHVKMGVFWSGTDMDTIAKIGAGGWFLSTVFNQKNEMKSAYYGVRGQSLPWGECPLFIDNLETKIEERFTEEERAWDAEYQENVTHASQAWMQGAYANDIGLPALSSEPSGKPPGMSRKAWKKHLKEASPLDSVIDRITNPEPMDNDYGFTYNEQEILDAMGWLDLDIENCIQNGFTPTQILCMADQGIQPQDVYYAINQGMTPTEILHDWQDDDCPVADRRFYEK